MSPKSDNDGERFLRDKADGFYSLPYCPCCNGKNTATFLNSLSNYLCIECSNVWED